MYYFEWRFIYYVEWRDYIYYIDEHYYIYYVNGIFGFINLSGSGNWPKDVAFGGQV